MELLILLIMTTAPFAALGFYGWKLKRERHKAWLDMINTVTPAKSKHDL
jgi:hypothetical protein